MYFSQASRQIAAGDVFVHCTPDEEGRPVRSALARAIAEIGRGRAYHCSMADRRADGTPVIVEMYPPVGRERDLRCWVDEVPGVIHWLRVPDLVTRRFGVAPAAQDGPFEAIVRYDRASAVAKIREYLGVRYGFSTIGRDYLAASWGRWISRMPANDEVVDWLPVCSVAVLDALQAGFGGWDLLRDLNTACAQPEDLLRICVLEDMGALYPG